METPVSNGTVKVPQITVTEPSPLILNDSISSIAENPKPSSGDTKVEMSHTVQNTEYQEPAPENATSAELFTSNEANSSGGFTTAQECTDCVVPMSESEPHSMEATTTATLEPEQDDFRTGSTTGGCSSVFFSCLMRYEQMWERIDHRCRLPFWLLLMIVPISAGVMGSLYMYSCPAATMLPSAVFSIGITLMAVMTIRVCVIFHRMSNGNADSRKVLNTLLLISMFITIVFFATESVLYWLMDSTSQPETDRFCDPTFVKYAFWWNCVMWVVMVPLIAFPA